MFCRYFASKLIQKRVSFILQISYLMFLALFKLSSVVRRLSVDMDSTIVLRTDWRPYQNTESILVGPQCIFTNHWLSVLFYQQMSL